MTNPILDAKEYFYKKDYKNALNIFLKENDFYSAGLCALLNKNEKQAQSLWLKNHRNSRASSWGLCVLDYINLRECKYKPCFFQTRAYLEIYINLFIENNYIEWAQNLIGACDILYKSNPEAYKFIARALYANGYVELAIKFCKKTLNLFYADPEAFLILSQSYYLLGNLEDALDCINRVNNMISNYYPSIVFEKVLRSEIEKAELN